MLKASVRSRSIELQYDESIAPARGVSRGGWITLLPGLPSADQLSKFVHEIAHELRHRDERRKETNRTSPETEAEAIAFVICRDRCNSSKPQQQKSWAFWQILPLRAA